MNSTLESSSESLHTFSPITSIYEERAYTWSRRLLYFSFIFIVCYFYIQQLAGSILGLHGAISVIYQQQPCISDIYFVILKIFRNDFCIPLVKNIYSSKCVIVGGCEPSPVFLWPECACIVCLMLSILIEGIWEFYVANIHSTVSIVRFKQMSKYMIGFFEIALFAMMLLEKLRLDKLQYYLSFIQNKEIIRHQEGS